MSTPSTITFFSGRSELFTQEGGRWRRLSVTEEAHGFSGFDHQTRETYLGIGIEQRPNGLLRIKFDLWKLDVNLQPAAIERLKNKWEGQAANFSKPLFRSVSKRVQFSKTFAHIEILPEQLDGWRRELEHVLSNSESYECVSRRPLPDELATESSKQP